MTPLVHHRASAGRSGTCGHVERRRSARCADGTRRIAVALGFGIASHALFALAIAAMFTSLYDGLHGARGTLHGGAAIAADAALALQFPLLHSALLTQRGRALLARLGPRELGRDLAPTTFAAIASVQLLATFVAWSPSGVELYRATGPASWLWSALYASSWLLLVLALRDARLSVQTGAIGWTAVLRGERVDYGSFPTRGLFRACRQPVYVAFALTLWTGPVLTLDRLVLALAWTAYCAIGPLHKERRYRAWFGEEFARYRAQVPYMWPRLRT